MNGATTMRHRMCFYGRFFDEMFEVLVGTFTSLKICRPDQPWVVIDTASTRWSGGGLGNFVIMHPTIQHSQEESVTSKDTRLEHVAGQLRQRGSL